MTILKYEVYKGDLRDLKTDSLIVIIPSENDKPLIPMEIREYFGDLIDRVVKSEEFKGLEDEVLLIHTGKDIERLVLVGMGSSRDYEAFRVAVSNGINKLSSTRASRIGVYIRNLSGFFDSRELVFHTITIAETTLYDPGLFKSERREGRLKEALLIVSGDEDLGDLVNRASIISDAINYARRIADTPSSIMNPEGIEEEALKLARRYGLKIRVLHREDLEKEGLNGILAVGSGGGVPPRLIILEYKGREGDEWDYGLVGKTVTFDAGGLNLKPTGYIDNMKYDKSGGAVVLGIMRAIAELKPSLNIIAALPVVENLPGPKAYKPRDVIKMYNGLTVEIGNTDAEGRIILGDALAFIDKNYKPKLIIDLATLTGAIVIALGNYAAGLFTENDEVAEKLFKYGLLVGERVWRMPLWKEYYEQLKSDIADINNIGGRPAGAITAAALLSKFVSDKKKWVHLDIAGVSWVEKGHPKKPYYKQAATGFGVKLLTYYILKEHNLL
jgi:leucyl aminopeptidase